MKLHRNSQDGVCYNEGNFLLETCKSNNFFILIGRCGKDKKGTYIFKNMSIIDYATLSAETLNFFADFEIREMDALYSDGHALFVTTLKFQNIVQVKTPISVRKPKHQAKWQANKTDEFISNLEDLKIYETRSNLEQALDNIHNINKKDMNELC